MTTQLLTDNFSSGLSADAFWLESPTQAREPFLNDVNQLDFFSKTQSSQSETFHLPDRSLVTPLTPETQGSWFYQQHLQPSE